MTPLARQLRACKTHKERLELLEKHSPGANLSGADFRDADLSGLFFVMLICVVPICIGLIWLMLISVVQL